ncbi:MAG: hypothetical protein MJ215_00390 [Spirochaetia bacterium]|nr:hypothetical protein [Spirochaetia bacterium]
MKKIFILCLIFLILPFYTFAEKRFSITPEFKIDSNDDMDRDDFYNLKGSLRLKFQATDDIDLVFKPELDKYDVDIDEISARIRFLDRNTIKVGKFENILSLDDYLDSYNRIFARKNIVTRELDDQGYLSDAIGAKYEYRNRHDDGFGGFIHAMYIPSQFEPQVNGGFYWQSKDEDMLAGIFGAYYPFINHKGWGNEHACPTENNFMGDLVYMDYRKALIYGAELTIGTSLINPVGKINFDPDTDHPAFWGADAHVGYRVRFNDDLNWLPALRGTVLFPEISEMDCNRIEALWGNQFTYKKVVKLHVDGGLGIVTKHDYSDDNDVKTKLEWRWAVSLDIKI